jgi:hypothetical protein
MKFGSREIVDVVFRAKSKMTLGSRTFYKNDPVLYFDTLKTSSLEGAVSTSYAQGGRGNARLIAWDGDRTLTLNMEDALLSMESFSILAGADLLQAGTNKGEELYVHSTTQVEVTEKNTITLDGIIACHNNKTKYTAAEENYNANADIFCMVLSDSGEVEVEPCVPADVKYVDGSTVITCYANGAEGAVDIVEGDIVLVDYYIKKTSGAQEIDITPEVKSKNFYIEGSTLYRRQSDGYDMPAEIIIPNAKVQSNFTISMASTGDPSTFSFVVDAFPDYTKFNKTKKVLAALQVVTDDEGDEDSTTPRAACDATGEDAGE